MSATATRVFVIRDFRTTSRDSPAERQTRLDLISNVLPFGALWYGEPKAIENSIGYAKYFSYSHHAVISVYDDSGNVIETHEHGDDCKGER